ncbi:MAG: exodeoxyribonuclease VII small subunit [Oscillospiraceae bacterium]|nr:exodeoxyribonuclease VII small subunit [Oscillospiraceae bacterium]
MKKTVKFEDDLKRLEEIVAALEKGEGELEKALALFAEGAELVKKISSVLDRAEQQVNILSRGEGGELTEEPFEI